MSIEKIFLTHLNLNGNQIKNIKAQIIPLGEDLPNASDNEGRFLYDQNTKKLVYSNGEQWIAATAYSCNNLATEASTVFNIFDSQTGDVFNFRAVGAGDTSLAITKNGDVIEFKVAETYTETLKQYARDLVAAVNAFHYEVVSELPTASADTMYTIYLVPVGSEANNVYEEYITLETKSDVEGGDSTYSWEMFGTTALDLSGYQLLVTGATDEVASFDENGQVKSTGKKVGGATLATGEGVDSANILATEAAVDAHVQAVATQLQTNIDNVAAAKADKVADAVEGNLAGLDANGNLTDSGKKVGGETLAETTDANTLATEKAVETAIEDLKAKLGEVIEWGNDSNANDYIETGMYHFAGYRLNPNDNLPMTNYGDKANVAFTLLVDQHQGQFIDATSSNVNSVVSHTLFLGNRQGSETKIYTRQGQYDGTKDLNENKANIVWEPWSEVVTSRTLMINNFESDLANITEIGLYTGVNQTTGEVFKLEVINNYAVADTQGLPNTILQSMTVVGLDGSSKELQRTKLPTGEWTAWSQVTDEDKQDLVAGAVENNVATFDAEGQVKDSGVKAGGAQFGSEVYECLKTVGGGEPIYYTTIKGAGSVIPVGTIVYSDVTCATPVGTVSANLTSGNYTVTLNNGDTANVYSHYYDKPSDKALATEAGVVGYVDPKVVNLQTQINQINQTTTEAPSFVTYVTTIATSTKSDEPEFRIEADTHGCGVDPIIRCQAVELANADVVVGTHIEANGDVILSWEGALAFSLKVTIIGDSKRA